MIGDHLDKEIEDELKINFAKMLIQISVYTLTRESFCAMCRSILSRFQRRFNTGWQQISVVYCGKIFPRKKIMSGLLRNP